MPERWFLPDGVQTAKAVDYSAAALSPADAIAQVEKELNQPVTVDLVQLLNIQGKPVYRVFMDEGMRLVDAASGELLWVSPEMAEAMVRDNFGPAAQLNRIEQLEKNDVLYPFGELPVYRIRFQGDGSNIYYVSLMSGSISHSNAATRIRAAITSLHTFEPIKLFTASGAVRKGLLVILSVIGVVVSLTGYIIFLLPYFRRKPKRKQSVIPNTGTANRAQ
jgi:hypothetical protein